MDDELALIRAVLDRPDDSLARLVYADWLDDRGDPRAAWLRATALGGCGKDHSPGNWDRLRTGVDQNWLALLDSTDRFTLYWRADLARQVEALGHAGKPLLNPSGLANLALSHTWMKALIGAYIYPITLRNGRLHIIGRMRVMSVGPRGSNFGEAEGAPVRFDRALPPEALTRVRYLDSRDRERGLAGIDENDRLTIPTSLAGFTRLTHAAARELDWLLFTEGRAPVVRGGSSSQLGAGATAGSRTGGGRPGLPSVGRG